MNTPEYMNTVYRDMIENIPDGLVLIDQNGLILQVNKAYETLLGVVREDIIGNPIGNLSTITQLPAIGELVLKNKKPITIDQVLLRTNKTVLVSFTPLFDDTGELKEAVGIVRDISELSKLRQQLSDIEQTNEKYMATITHLQKTLDNNDKITIIAHDSRMQNVLSLVRKMARIDETILVTGETGVGKEEIAKLIYSESRRSHMPFIKINCGAIPENLIESELFGYEHGAFTGARKGGQPGLFEAADKGTLFLDEIGELPLNLQVKLLRAIQEKEITRIGGTHPVKIDVRLICATNRDLKEMVQQKTFREDLYYRLNVIPIYIPALRERKKDIRPLADLFLRNICEKYEMQKLFDARSYKLLENYSWPGNIRELRNIVERVAIMSQHLEISADRVSQELHINNSLSGQEEADDAALSVVDQASSPALLSFDEERPVNFREIIEQTEAFYITSAFDKCQSIRKAARMLQMDPATYLRKYRKYNPVTDTGRIEL